MRTRIFVVLAALPFLSVSTQAQTSGGAETSVPAIIEHSLTTKDNAKPPGVDTSEKSSKNGSKPVRLYPEPIHLPISASHQRLGRAFWVSWGIAIGLAVVDVELTAHCTQDVASCREHNALLFDSKPTRLKMYSLKAAGLGLGFGSSYYDRQRGRRRWVVIPAIAIGLGAGVDAGNAYVYKEKLDQQNASKATSSGLAPSLQSSILRPYRSSLIPSH